jgi:DNA modification methylase
VKPRQNNSGKTKPKTMQLNRIVQYNVLHTPWPLEDNSIDCCVTSPPYWGLRDYNNPEQIGLEKSPEEYVHRMVQVFSEVKRVLKPTGTLWLNLGDSYSNGSNFLDCFDAVNKFQSIVLTDAFSIRISGHSIHVPHVNHVPEQEIFIFLFGVERIFIKKRNNNFCKVINLFNAKGYACLTGSFSQVVRNKSTLEIFFNEMDNITIVHSDLNPDLDSVLRIFTIGRRAGEKVYTTLAVKKATEPIPEGICDIESVWYSITQNAAGESIIDINFINKPIAFADTFNSAASHFGNLKIRKASVQHLNFFFSDLSIDFTSSNVSHVYYVNAFGSLVSHMQKYEDAIQRYNEFQRKQEIGIPDLVKIALKKSGWICRQTIIWAKPNPMPESVTDRCTKSHEYIFLLSKSHKYYFDQDAIRVPLKDQIIARLAQDIEQQKGSDRVPGKTNGNMKSVVKGHPIGGNGKYTESAEEKHRTKSGKDWQPYMGGSGTLNHIDRSGYFDGDGKLLVGSTANKKSVWTVTTKPFAEAHFATFPEELITPCILAGCPKEGIVLDPFMGAGTTGLVALSHGRKFIGFELNPDYIAIANKRLKQKFGMFYNH